MHVSDPSQVETVGKNCVKHCAWNVAIWCLLYLTLWLWLLTKLVGHFKANAKKEESKKLWEKILAGPAPTGTDASPKQIRGHFSGISVRTGSVVAKSVAAAAWVLISGLRNWNAAAASMTLSSLFAKSFIWTFCKFYKDQAFMTVELT